MRPCCKCSGNLGEPNVKAVVCIAGRSVSLLCNCTCHSHPSPTDTQPTEAERSIGPHSPRPAP